jgi:kinesin family protein 5
VTLRRELAESKVLLEQHGKSIDDLTYEKDALNKKKLDLEGRLGSLEVEYEELLDKTIADEEAQVQKNVDMADTISGLKVKRETWTGRLAYLY